MKVLIVYFSATGNTKYGTALIKHGLEQTGGNHCDCVDIKNFSPDMIPDYDLIGFACPVFAYKPTLNMLELIRSLPDGNQKPCFTFHSYAGELSNTFWIMKTELEKRHYQCIAQKAMLAQGTWTTTRSPGNINCADEPSAATQAEVIAFGQSLPELFDRCRYEGLAAADPGFHFGIWHVISYFYNDDILKNLFVTRVDANKCTECGRCVQGCPTGRMNFTQFPNPKGKCIGCYRCINLCPEDAVEGWLTKGKIRYKGLPASLKLLNNISETAQ